MNGSFHDGTAPRWSIRRWRAATLAIGGLLTALSATAQQCPYRYLRPPSVGELTLPEMPEMLSKPFQEATSDDDTALRFESVGSAGPKWPRLDDGFAVVTIQESYDPPHAYRVVLFELHKRPAAHLVQAMRTLDAGVAEDTVRAVSTVVLATHYPPKGCPVMWTDGYDMRVSVFTQGYGYIAGDSYVPNAIPGSQADGLWRLWQVLADFAQEKAGNEEIRAAVRKVDDAKE